MSDSADGGREKAGDSEGSEVHGTGEGGGMDGYCHSVVATVRGLLAADDVGIEAPGDFTRWASIRQWLGLVGGLGEVTSGWD